MSDEIVEQMHERPEEPGHPLPNPYLLTYDFFKHMTSISVLSLGGILTLAGSIFADAHQRGMLFSVVLTAGAGLTAYLGMIEMVESAEKGRKPRFVARIARSLAPALFGAGVGAFLMTVQRAFS